jgi:hypothetical protein
MIIVSDQSELVEAADPSAANRRSIGDLYVVVADHDSFWLKPSTQSSSTRLDL